jgi:chromosome partitioning protein
MPAPGLVSIARIVGVSAYDLLTQNASVGETAVETAVPHLSIIPSTMDLLGVEMEIAGTPDRVFRLRKALQAEDAKATATC